MHLCKVSFLTLMFGIISQCPQLSSSAARSSWPVLGGPLHEDLFSKLDSPSSGFPSSPYSSNKYSSSSSSVGSLPPVDMLKRLFREVNLKGTQLGAMLDEGTASYGFSQARRTYTFGDILEMAAERGEGSEELRELLSAKSRRGSSNPFGIVGMHDDDIDDSERGPVRGNQLRGYEGCRRDYATLAEPVTDRIQALVQQALCNDNATACNMTGGPPPAEPTRNETETWGRIMIDALGKIETGLSEGKLYWVGSYEMCLNLLDEQYTFVNSTFMEVGDTFENRTISGKYCRLKLTPKSLASSNFSSVPLGLLVGICVPDTCSRGDIYHYIMEENYVLTALLDVVMQVNISEVYCGQQDFITETIEQQTNGALLFVLILFIVIIIATIYDGCIRKPLKRRRLERQIDNGQILHPEVTFPPFVKEGSEYGDEIEFEGDSCQEIELKENQIEPAIELVKTDDHVGEKKDGPNDLPAGYTPVSEKDLKNHDSGEYNVSGETKKPAVNQMSASTSQLVTPEVDQSKCLENMTPSILERLELLLVGFSFYSNTRRIFTTRLKAGHFDVLNGVRALSFAYMMLGQTYLMGPVYTEVWTTANLFPTLNKFPREWTFQPIINFSYNSDSFLLLSALLACYWWLRRDEEAEKTPPTSGLRGRRFIRLVLSSVRFVLHKYWRIMPAMMIVLMLFCLTYRYSEGTPLFPSRVADAENCLVNWWPNLLLIHNLLTDAQCMGWSWYLGIVFQLHIASLVVLVPLVVLPALGYVILAALYAVHLGVTAYISSYTFDNGDWYYDYFQTPWCRAGPFLIGTALGIIMYKTKCQVKMHWLDVTVGWILSLGLISLASFISYDQFQEGGQLWGKDASIAFDVLSRSLWALGLAWIIFACSAGYGGIINTFLSWGLWMPLSKLAYPSYLMHTMMIYTWVYGQFNLIYLSHMSLIYMFFGHLALSLLNGFFLVASFHYPISIGFERALALKSKMAALLAGRNPIKDMVREKREEELITKLHEFHVPASLQSNNAADVTNHSSLSPQNYFTSNPENIVTTKL